jgi:hypothetical protein
MSFPAIVKGMIWQRVMSFVPIVEGMIWQEFVTSFLAIVKGMIWQTVCYVIRSNCKRNDVTASVLYHSFQL